MIGCLIYVFCILLKLVIFFYFYFINGYLICRIFFIYNLMNICIFWFVLLIKIWGVMKIYIYFFKVWSMCIFVNVYIGVVFGISLIYMYDVSK